VNSRKVATRFDPSLQVTLAQVMFGSSGCARGSARESLPETREIKGNDPSWWDRVGLGRPSPKKIAKPDSK
jgi:hypothetical protein